MQIVWEIQKKNERIGVVPSTMPLPTSMSLQDSKMSVSPSYIHASPYHHLLVVVIEGTKSFHLLSTFSTSPSSFYLLVVSIITDPNPVSQNKQKSNQKRGRSNQMSEQKCGKQPLDGIRIIMNSYSEHTTPIYMNENWLDLWSHKRLSQPWRHKKDEWYWEL